MRQTQLLHSFVFPKGMNQHLLVSKHVIASLQLHQKHPGGECFTIKERTVQFDMFDQHVPQVKNKCMLACKQLCYVAYCCFGRYLAIKTFMFSI